MAALWWCWCWCVCVSVLAGLGGTYMHPPERGGKHDVHVNGMRGKEHTTHDMYMEMACVARQIKTRDARTHPKVLADVGVAPALGGERLRHLWKE